MKKIGLDASTTTVGYAFVDGKDIVINAKGDHEFITNEKKKIKQISHKKVLDLIMNK